MQEGKVPRYYPRPDNPAAKPGGPLKNQALTKNKFDQWALNAVDAKPEDMSRSELLAIVQASQTPSVMPVRVSDDASSSDSDWLADDNNNNDNRPTNSTYNNTDQHIYKIILSVFKLQKTVNVAADSSRPEINNINNSQLKFIVCWNVNGLSARF